MKLSGLLGATVVGAITLMFVSPPAHAGVGISRTTERVAHGEFVVAGVISGIPGNAHVVSLGANDWPDAGTQWVQGGRTDWNCPVGATPPVTGHAASACAKVGEDPGFLAGSLPGGFTQAGEATVGFAAGLASATAAGHGNEYTGVTCGGMACWPEYSGREVTFSLTFTANAPVLILPGLGENGEIIVVKSRAATVGGTFEGLPIQSVNATIVERVKTLISVS